MNDSILRAAATIVPLAPFVVLAVATVLAIRALNGERLRARPGFAGALVVATLMAAAAAVLLVLFVVSFAGFDSGPGPEYYRAALPAGAVTFVVAFLAGFVGYVIVALRWPSPGAAIGALLGAPLMAVLLLGAGSVSLGLANAVSESAARAATVVVEKHSADITIRAELLEATLDPAVAVPTVASVHLRVTLNSAHSINFEAGSKSAWPRFRFFSVGAGAVEAREGSLGPDALLAGRDAVWDLNFDVPAQGPYSGTSQAPGPGTWPLHVVFLDAAGAEYDVTTEVDVQPMS